MKNKFSKKYKNVLIIKGTQGMAKLSLAVVSGSSAVRRSAGELFVCASETTSTTVKIGGRLGSTPRARMLNRAGRQLNTVNSVSSINTEAIASLNPRARRSGLLWAQLAIVVLALLVPALAAFAPSSSRLPLSPEKASAATSNQLNFQGRLLTNTGALVPDGVYNMEFNLYNVASGGSTLWTEDRLVTNTQGVSVQNGYYSVYLGQYDAFPAIDWSQDLYLGMTIRGTASCVWGSCTPADSEMTPRFKLTAVPYAFRASNVASSSTNAASSNSDGVSITTGNALGATSNSGNITVDVGTATGTTGTISLGSTNASALTIGRAGVTTTLQGSVTLNGSGTALSVTNDASIGGALTVNGNTTIGNATSDTLTVEANATFNGSLVVSTGDQFTNAGSTVFTALSISDVSGGGNIGSAASTVDVATTFNVNQTTAGQTLTLPNPTSATSGRMAFVNNVGSASFTMYGSVIATGKSNAFIWNGSAWVTTVSLSGSVVNTIGTIDSQTKSADGAVISSNAIYLQTADASFAGLVSTGTQTFAGAKTFNGLVTAAAGLTVSSGQNLTLSGVTGCVSLKTNGSGVVGCGANEFTYVVAASNSVNSATANYVGNGDTGAANDGDQVEINAAIAAADAAGGGTVYLLEGTYTIDDTILLENNVTLMGSGTETVILSAADGGVADNFNMIENSDFSGGNYLITIRDLVIDGNNSNISASTRTSINFEKVGSGVGSGALTGFIIDNVHLINNQSDGLFAYDSRNSRISNSVIRDTGSGVSINMNSSDRIQIDGNRIVGGSGIGTLFTTVTGSTISNNTYDGVGSSGDNAISLRDGSNNNVIDGNVIQNTGGIAIEFNGSTGSNDNTISNNSISGSVDEAIYLTLAFSTNVTGNTLYDNEDTAGATDAQILVTGNADENQIVGNFIQDSSGNQSYAINLSGANVNNAYVADNYLLVTDGILNTGTNTSYGNQSDGSGNLRVQAQGSGTINLLSNTDVTGTLTVSSTATFNGNTVIGNANTDTLTINAGTSGSGITLADSSFYNCAGLTTSASGVLTCSTTAYASTLQNAYDNDANGSDAVIALTSTDGAVVVRDAASTIGTLFVVEANGGADYLSVASTGTTVTGPSGGSSTALTVNQGAASNVGLAINGASTASANFLQVTGFGESYSSLQVDNVGRTTIRPVTGGDGNALVIRNAAGTTTPFYVDTSTGYTYTYGQIVTGIVDITGATKYSVGGSNTSFTTPQGASISAKLAFDLYNPGGSNQLVALGLPSGANAYARGISLFDNRAAGDNQAILSVFSPDESDVFGLSSDGSNSYGYLKATSGLGLGVKIGTTIAATFETSGDANLNYDLSVDGTSVLGANQTLTAWGTGGVQLQTTGSTYTDSSTAGSGTATNAVFNSFAVPTLAASNSSVTTTNAATVYIQGAPTAGTNQTITNPYAFWVDGGLTRLDGNLVIGDAEMGNAGFLAEFQGSTTASIAVTAGDASSSSVIYLGTEGNETGQGALSYDNNTDIYYITANGGSGTVTLDANSTFTVGHATATGELRLADGSSNYVTLNVNALAGDYTLSVPTITANDTLCVVTLANCAGAGREFTAVVGTSVDSSNISAAGYVADGNTGTAGDGDQVEINAAIDAVNAAGGGKVLLLEGTYTIDATIDIDDDVEIIGSGQGATIITIPNSLNTNTSFFSEDSNPDNWAIKDLTINMNSNGNQSSGNYTGIDVRNASSSAGRGGLIENVEIFDFTRSQDTAIYLLDTYNTTVRGNRIYNGEFAVYIEGDGSTPQNINVFDNYIQDMDSLGIYATDSVSLNISNNTVNSHDGVGTDNAAIELQGAEAVSITDNIIMYGTGYGIRAIGSVSDTTVKGNRIEHMTRHGIYGTFGYSDITNNDIWDTDTANADAATYGQIVITGAAYTTIANNNIAGSASSDVGIRFESDQGSPVDSVIANNVIGLHTTVGIYLETGSDRNIITGNSIYDNDTNGIFVTDSNNNLIQNNSLYDNGAATTSDGIAVAGNSDNNQIIGNRITDTAGTGQAIDLQASTVDNTYLADNTYSGTGALTINDSGTNTRYANQISAASVLQSNSMALTSNANTILTGSIDPTASTSVTGVSTLFTRELQVGDKITVSGQTRTVVTITSDTALTVDTAFSDNANDTSVDRIPVGLYVKTTDSSANALYIADSSNATVLSVSTANSGSANNSMVFRGIGVFGNSGEVDVAYNGGAEIRIGNNFYGDDYWTGGTGGFTYTFTPAAYTTGSASPFAGLTMTQNFAPTSGTNVYSAIASTPTINQTGTAAGITRGLYVNPTLTAFNDFRGIQVDATSSYATANNQQGAQITVTDTGAVASGTDTTLGASINLTRTGASGGTINNTGLNISLTGDTGGTSTNTGLNVSVTGADTNYAALFSGGNVGIGDSTPAALLTVGASDAFQVDNSGNVTAAGLLTANGGLTIQAGDTFTFNSDGFTDFTGGGLINNSGLLSVDDSTATGFFRNGGNSFSATATLGTNDANSLVLETNNQSAVTIASGGAVTLQNNTNSTAAFSVRTSLASTVLGVDTTTRNVCINCTTATAALSVNGVDDEVQLRVKADAAQTTTVFEVLNGSSVNLLSVAANGATTISDDLAIDGGDLTTTATTFNLLNSTATTVNAFGGATTALNLGTTTGTINLGSSATTNTQTFNIANGQVTTGATSVNILSGAAGTSGTATLSLGNSDRVTQIDIGNVAADAARTINLGTGSNTVGIDTLNIGTGATTVAGGKTINIGNGTPTGSGTNLISIGTIANASTLTLQGGTGSTAVSIQTGSGGTLSVGSSGVANTIQVGNTTGAVAQTINIGNNTTASSSTTLSMGSTIGTSPTLIQGGTSGVTVKPANGTTAFQVQNASSASLFTVDTTNNVLSLLGNNNGAPQAWQSNANTIPQHDNIANAVVYNGYIYVPGGDNSSSVYSTVAYARVNASGTIDTWSTTGTLSTAVTNTNAIEANGYLYVLGGSTNTASTNVQSIVQYAKINADGTLGTFTTTSSLPAGRKNGSVVTLNGYMYYIGGDSSATATPANTKTVYFAKINADGTLGTWANVSNANAGYLAGTGTYGQKAFTANGYIYVMGGNGTTSIYYARPGSSGDITSNFTQEATNSIPAGAGNSFGAAYYSNGYVYNVAGFNASVVQPTVYYAPLNANGSVGTWAQQSTANDLPAGRATFAFGQSNGYFYVIGGYNGSTGQTTVYYTSLQRIKAGGNLDLSAYSLDGMTDPNGAGSLTAGNTLLIGTLQVQDTATFNDNVNVNGNLSVGNGNIAFASGAARTISVGTRPDAGTGYNLTLQAGVAGSGNNNGGNLVLAAASGSGTGVKGLVVIDTPTFTTASTQNCAGADCTITQANIDSNGAVVITFSSTGFEAAMPDPTITTAGRIVYVTAANGSSDFTLCLNDVAAGGTYDGTCNTTTGNSIAMRANTTATLVWNGSDWTAAGASSSTDLQAAYNNTLSSAGGAEIVLKNSSSSNGLTIRNGTSTDEITGGLLEVQTSIGSNLFTVNNNATEYANNGGAESSTFTAWTAHGTGPSVTRYTTAGNNIATGAGSIFVDTTSTANTGAKNTLTTALTANLRYKVSYTARHTSSTGTFSTLETYFSNDGTTASVECGSDTTIYYNKWTRVDCTFTPTSVGASNAIFFRHTDGVEHDFYIDNFSVTVDASSNHAVDGQVDVALGTNWQAYDADGGAGTSGVTRDTTNIYDTSGAVAVATTAGSTEGEGVRNNMQIIPTVSTQYLVTFYAKSTTAFSDIKVGFLPAGGSSLPLTAQLCADYNTQTVSTTGWTKITCILMTPSSGISDPDLVIYQGSAAARTFYIDNLTITLNTNNSSNVQVGGGQKGGPTTLFTLDRSNGAPIADNNDAYLGSMYYDTSTGRIQCYEADGWGACGAAPDNIVNLNPEYAGAVLNGTGVGTMTADFCSNDAALSVNSGLCSSGQAKNYYRWTSPQATQQTYSIYVTYQLPATFNGFSSDDTVQLTARVDNTTNASVTYEMFKSTGSAVTQCGSGETNVITGGGGAANTWYTYGISGNEASGCSFNSSSASNFVIFKINMKANSNASAYVSTLSFTTTGR